EDHIDVGAVGGDVRGNLLFLETVHDDFILSFAADPAEEEKRERAECFYCNGVSIRASPCLRYDGCIFLIRKRYAVEVLHLKRQSDDGEIDRALFQMFGKLK